MAFPLERHPDSSNFVKSGDVLTLRTFAVPKCNVCSTPPSNGRDFPCDGAYGLRIGNNRDLPKQRS